MGAKTRRFFLKRQAVVIVIHILRRNQLEIKSFLGKRMISEISKVVCR